jgi:hypothetical protein
MNNKVLIISIIFFAFSACTKELAIKDGNIHALVINSIINPDSLVRVNLSQVAGFNVSDINFIKNADVDLYENDKPITSLIYDTNGWYQSFYLPKQNGNYRIIANSTEYHASAETRIPIKVKILNAVYSLYEFTNDAGENSKIPKTQLSFIDNKESKDYYEVFLSYQGYYQIYPHQNSLSTGPLIDDPILLNEGDEDYYPTTYFFSDELFNGDTCSLIFPEGGSARYYDSIFQEDDQQTFVHLRKISEEYYHYRKYWTRHYYNQQNENNLEDPIQIVFQGEPVEMYTNIEGGYGILASYSESTLLLQYQP